ncbi:hypothetical protein [uncultured Sphingomonas sp.]|uniref:hypothetical protein n=1 Tax=uncultured Sphingomonas sp. TaxID=158754 RepID=UPI0035CA06B6
MCLLDDREYYSKRIITSRELAARAASPEVAKIHSDFAAVYERALSIMAPESPTMASGVAQFG